MYRNLPKDATSIGSRLLSSRTASVRSVAWRLMESANMENSVLHPVMVISLRNWLSNETQEGTV